MKARQNLLGDEPTLWHPESQRRDQYGRSPPNMFLKNPVHVYLVCGDLHRAEMLEVLHQDLWKWFFIQASGLTAMRRIKNFWWAASTYSKLIIMNN